MLACVFGSALKWLLSNMNVKVINSVYCGIHLSPMSFLMRNVETLVNAYKRGAEAEIRAVIIMVYDEDMFYAMMG
jgi:hypothetical protein